MFFRSLIAGLLLAFVSTITHAERLPVEAYGDLAAVRGVVISPDGTKFAMLIGSKTMERSMVVKEFGGKTYPRVPLSGYDPRGIRWLNNERVAVFLDKYKAAAGGRFKFERTRVLFMDLDGQHQKEIVKAGGFRRIPGDDRHMLAMIQETVATGMTRGAQSAQKTRSVKVDIYSGRVTTVENLPENLSNPVRDPEGLVRIYVKGKGERNKADIRYAELMARDSKSDKFKVIYRLEDLDDFPFSFAGWDGNRNRVFLQGRFTGVSGLESDTIALYTLNLKTGKVKLFRKKKVDISGMSADPYTHEVYAVVWDDGVVHREIFDPQLKGLQEQLEGIFAGKEVRITGWDEARSKFIVMTTKGGHSGVYYLVEPAAGKIVKLADQYPTIPESEIGDVEFIHYTARDGLKIPAYVSWPVGRERKNLPMIMLPHGGPRARDRWGNALWRQFFVNMGYVVMQPQYRGSEGFGLKFRDAGNRKWGAEMQDDLTDGVNYLVKQGAVDASRVCIVGWSYGGYAAMAGATVTPEVYRCVIAGAGVSDLIASLKRSGSGSGKATRGITEWWEESIGDPFTEKARLTRTSARFNADKVVAPILLIHGERDYVVPIEQSEYFADALKREGKPFTFLRLKNEGHNLEKGETRIEQMVAMRKFLDAHNPAY
jgi:dipeptidyl aminopeptidase/acylaminoacyl peptidase